jgi:hypothetical protein
MFCDLIFWFYKTITKGEIEFMIFLKTFGQGPKLVPWFLKDIGQVFTYTYLPLLVGPKFQKSKSMLSNSWFWNEHLV